MDDRRMTCWDCARNGVLDSDDNPVCRRGACYDECPSFVPVDFQFRAIKDLAGKTWNSPINNGGA